MKYVFLAFSCISSLLFSTEYVWTGNFDSNWGNIRNWNPTFPSLITSSDVFVVTSPTLSPTVINITASQLIPHLRCVFLGSDTSISILGNPSSFDFAIGEISVQSPAGSSLTRTVRVDASNTEISGWGNTFSHVSGDGNGRVEIDFRGTQNIPELSLFHNVDFKASSTSASYTYNNVILDQNSAFYFLSQNHSIVVSNQFELKNQSYVYFDNRTLDSTVGFFMNGKGSGVNIPTDVTAGISGVISGSFDFNKKGSGTLILSGNNTYSGGTVIHDGTLQIVSDQNIGAASAPVTFYGGVLHSTAPLVSSRTFIIKSGGGTLETDRGSSILSGVISGTGLLTKKGSGALILTGENTWSGGISVLAGNLQCRGSSLGTGTALVNTSLIFDEPSEGTCNAIISGSTSLQKQGKGTVTLTKDSTYSGGTILKEGTLSISSMSQLGDASGSITFMGGTLEWSSAISTSRNFTLSSDGGAFQTDTGVSTISGVLSGSGSLIKLGNGNLVLSGANTYSGGTYLDEGVLSIDSMERLGASSGSITFAGGILEWSAPISTSHSFTIGNGGGAIQTDMGTNEISGAIVGVGTFVKLGSGSLRLSGTNSYSGGTILRSGILQISSDGNLGASSGTVTGNGGTLQFSSPLTTSRNFILDSGNLTVDVPMGSSAIMGKITGVGTLTKKGSGTLTLQGNNSFKGGLDITEGVVVARGFSLGSGDTNIQTQLIFNEPTQGTCESNLQGIGSVTKRNEGTVYLTGVNTYSGNTFLEKGVLGLSSNENLGTGTIFCQGGGLLFTISEESPIVLSNDITIQSEELKMEVIGGSSAVIKGKISGPGKLTLSGDIFVLDNTMTYTGGTNILCDSLTLDSGASLLGQVNVSESSYFTIDEGASISSANITVQAGGTLQDDGKVYCDSDLKNYGTIKGSDTISFSSPDLTFQNFAGAHISPGDSPGTLTIAGKVNFHTHSFLEVSTNFSKGSQLSITGKATINPDVDVQMVFQSPTSEAWLHFLTEGFSFPILHAGSISGHFDDLVSPYPGFAAILQQTVHEYSVDMRVIPLSNLVSDTNQQAVAKIFDTNYVLQNADFLSVNQALYFLQLPQLEEALDQLHPALFNNIALAQEETTSYISKVLSQRLEEITWKNPDKNDRSWEVWGQGLRDYARQKGKKTLTGYTATTPGIIAGADVKIDHQFALGLHGAYTNTHIDWESKRAYGHTTTGYGGLYGSWYNKNFLVGLSILGGWNSSKASRSILFGEINRMAHHKAHGWEVSPQLELGGLWEGDFLSFEPFLKENYVYVHQNSYKENGAESLDLQVHSKNADMLRSEIGLGLFHCFQGNQLQLIPEIKLSYIYESRFQGKNTKAYFLNGSEETFSVKGLSPSRSLGHLSALLKGSSYHGFDLTLDYNFLLGKKYRDHKMALRLDYAF